MGTDYNKNPSIGYIGISQEPCHPTNILWTDEPWRGRMNFTGPDGIRDHRVTVEPEQRYVGIGTMSTEGTSETDYIWRPAPSTPFPRPRSSSVHVGEVGWGVPLFSDWSIPNTGRQIMLGEFRQDLEEQHYHKYQNSWYPGPTDKIDPNTDAALMMNVYQPRARTSIPGSRRSHDHCKEHNRTHCRCSFVSKKGNRCSTAMSYRNDGGSTTNTSQTSQPGQRTSDYLKVHE